MTQTPDAQARLARLRYRCRRGTRELELWLQQLLRQVTIHGAPELLDAFEALLDCNDDELQAWLLGHRQPPDARLLWLFECDFPAEQTRTSGRQSSTLSPFIFHHQFRNRIMTNLTDSITLKCDAQGHPFLEVSLRGMALLRDAAANKGTAFSLTERQALGLEGLLPPAVEDLETQLIRLYAGFKAQSDDVSRYVYLRTLQDDSETAFFALLSQHIEEMMPIVYTPTVGLGVQRFSHLYRHPRGLTFSQQNIDQAEQLVANYPYSDVRMIVATDASAILGIGDQGWGGIGISIGKLALYTAGGGLSPLQALPVDLDVGTQRSDLLEDPLYLGVREPRLSGPAYFELVDRAVTALHRRYPKAIIQWEDLSKEVAFEVLARYRDRLPCFNDDIQGTGAVVLAGLLAACHHQGVALTDQTVVVVGAGAGGVGVASAIIEGMVKEGLPREQARRQMFVLDGRGLVVDGITPPGYKQAVAQAQSTYAQWDIAGEVPSLREVVEFAKPTVLLGLSGVAGLFDESLVKTMASQCERPMIFPLSNPTANCEALPEDLYTWTAGRVIVATGSPFDPVSFNGQTHAIGQGNNAFIFPGLGFAAVHGECTRISDAMVLESAYALADYTIEHHAQARLVYPPIDELRDVSLRVAKRCLQVALEDGSSPLTELSTNDLDAFLQEHRWQPVYLPTHPADAQT